MDAGVHLPLIDFGGEGFSYRRLADTVDAARACGFAAVSANDHFVFPVPWLDGPTALAAVAGRSGEMALVTTLALATLRGPVPLAKALSALDILSGGRVIAGLGPGSSEADYLAVGVTMWTWVTDKRADAERVLAGILGPLVGRDPAELRGRVCVGPASECAELLSRYARAGCQRVHFWPVGDERRQVELIAGEVMPRVSG